MSETIAQASQLIRDRLEEIERERKALERALAQLTENGRASRPGARGPASGRRRRIAPRGQRRRQLLELVAKRPGIKPGEAAQEIGISPNHVYTLVRTLRERGEMISDERGLRLAPKTATAKAPGGGESVAPATNP